MVTKEQQIISNLKLHFTKDDFSQQIWYNYYISNKQSRKSGFTKE